VGLKFREEDFISIARRILTTTTLSIGFVAAPADQQKAIEIADCMASKRVVGIQTPGPLDLAALLERAAFLLTPEGGAAHLAAAMNTPALVIWSEGPFKKWYSRGKNHAYLHAEPGETHIPLERVWTGLQPFLPAKNEAAPPPPEDYIQNSEAPPPPSIMP
jgi:ADP-heptose:LPS heptosyltransferase